MSQPEISKKHYQQIDVMKGLAIVSVIILHSLTRKTLEHSLAVFHIWQAVPVFLVLMGLNLGLSLKPTPISEIYTKSYFSKKATRILIPFGMVFLVSLLLGLLWKPLFNRDVLEFNEFTLVGLLPVSGKGNYFITLILQSILVLPLIAFGFKRRPVLTTVVLIVLEVLFLLLSKYFNFFDKETYLYSAALLRYFTAIAFGLWMAKAIKYTFNWRVALAFLVTGILGAVYLYYSTAGKLDIAQIYDNWETQNVLSFGYAGLLVYASMYTLPSSSDNPVLKFFASLGQASYHIFLVQVLYFGLMTKHSYIHLNLIVCLVLGYLFYLSEAALSKKVIG